MNGPWLEFLPIATAEEVQENRQQRIKEAQSETIERVINAIASAGGSVHKKFFENGTKELIGVSQKEGRLLLDRMLEDDLIYIDHEPTKSGQQRQIYCISK